MTLHDFMLCTSTSTSVITTIHIKEDCPGFGAIIGVREYFNQPNNIYREKYHDWKVHGIRVQNNFLRIDLYDE